MAHIDPMNSAKKAHCSNCSTEIADDAKFCGVCGCSVERNASAEGFCTSCGLRRGPGRFCGGCGAPNAAGPTVESDGFAPGRPPSPGSPATAGASGTGGIETFFRKFKPQHWAAVVIISLIDIFYLQWWWWAGLLAALGSVNSWIDVANPRKAKVDAPPTDPADETLADPAPAAPVDKNHRSNVITSIVVIAAIVLVGLYVLIAPYLSAFYLYSALERHDQPALERVVAFDDLRENLKRRLPAIPPTAIDEMVTPSAVMTALQANSPSDVNSSDAPLLGFLIASMHKDDYGHYLIGDYVVLCNYYVLWRVCDVAIK